MKLHAKQARNLLFALISISGAALGGMILHPMPVPMPLRHQFGPAERLFHGADTLRAAEGVQRSRRRVQNREQAQDLARHWRATLQDSRTMTIQEIPLRVRSFNHFELKRLKKLFSLETTAGKDSKPNREGVYRVGADHILVTAIEQGLRVETCITADDIGFVEQNRLIDAVKKIPLSRRERLETVLGLRQPREWTCLYIAATLPSSRKGFQEATSAWRSLREAPANP
jgi:hypothetical protein